MPAPEDGVMGQGVSKVSYQQAGLSSLEIAHNEAIKEGQWNNLRRVEIARFEESDKALRWMLPIGLTALMILGGLAYVLLSTNDDQTDIPDIVQTSFGEEIQDEDEKEEILFDHQSPEDEKNLKAYLDKMYAAKTVDELLLYCRKTEGLKEKMVNFYKGEEVDAKKIKELNASSSYGRKPGFITYRAETTDYDVEQGIIEYKNGKFKLDWESFVAYSEMSWEEMKRLKPTDPVVLRVVVNVANYYNNDFKDEARWQSLGLANPHEKNEVLHGYVIKGSAVESQVTNFGLSKDGYAVTVKAHFLKDSATNNQIVISEVVSDSWIGK